MNGDSRSEHKSIAGRKDFGLCRPALATHDGPRNRPHLSISFPTMPS